ncbi:tetratricopeptide repeat protein [Erythrobacter gaetbuli]|uniref:Tetratricopeptide repeat protein n=1 Tax=Qipengyuania gaetbuli TaxID=266952 RepID=A0A844Y088_9SPHN|nr:winged helix-turn-helix domain-containing protein [Qipengyuania gaetbuli]MXO50857.1 tetratricopeptide repeat protein [Qipengyuania gaetbuli]
MLRHVEYRTGDVLLYPDRRVLVGPSAEVSLEPRTVQVFELLASTPFAAVSRETLFSKCWGGVTVGEDSLNRSIYQLRRSLRAVGSVRVVIETIPAKGYALKVSKLPFEQVFNSAQRVWRQGWAKADEQSIARLQSAVSTANADNPDAWGLLALHLARAAEYEPIELTVEYVSRCEEAAATALSLDPDQGDARVALAILRPLFGDWTGARSRLQEILEFDPDHFAARHEMAVLEMATGRVSAAVPLISALLDEDPLAATLHYKRGWHLYCLGKVDEMDVVLDNALQVWPGHPGIWQCRNMTLAFTGRPFAALRLLSDDVARPTMPPHSLQFHREALLAMSELDDRKLNTLVRSMMENSGWQSLAVAAILYLCALNKIEEAMDVCKGYYLNGIEAPIKLRYDPDVEVSINDMHRRVTQPLFIPITSKIRQHDNFLSLCSRMGLTDYWDSTGITPDFLI